VQIVNLDGPERALALAGLAEPQASHMLTPGSGCSSTCERQASRSPSCCRRAAPHTAYFALKLRARLAAGETVLVHGAAGGVGVAALQVAKGLGARAIGVVSTDAKERLALQAGADEVLRADGPWKDQAKELTGGAGVDVVLDPVGGQRFTDSLRALAEGGRAVVVGFTAGAIPEVKVNRLLLNNVDVIGAGWGGYALGRPEVCRQIGAALDGMIAAGAVRPLVGARFPLERAAEALQLIDGRGATGTVVLELG
jgi:NADPH2:quinone reductase